MKIKFLFLVLLFVNVNHGFSQSFNEDKTAFTNFVKRMYLATPFEGVKIIEDYDHKYMLSVISVEKAKYPNESMMIRVAQVKAQSQVNTFLNGSNISMDMVIKTTDSKDSTGKTSSITESIESIKQNSVGFSQGLELLTNFENVQTDRMVFFYFREIKTENK
jgi:hypothetical protein